MMLNKINVCPIITDHLGTFKAPRSDKLLKRDFCLFFGVPLVIGVALASLGLRMPPKYADFSLLAHSIFIPLIVNVLFLIYSIKERPREEPTSEPEKRKREKSRLLLEDIYKNLSYAVLVAIVSVFALGMTKLIGLPPLWLMSDKILAFFNPIAVWLIYFAVYFLLIHMFLTALMIVKRTHVLLTQEFLDT